MKRNDENPEIVKEGDVTTYRPNDDRISGGKEHSVQSEARQQQGDEDLGVTGSTQGGAAGHVHDLSDTPET